MPTSNRSRSASGLPARAAAPRFALAFVALSLLAGCSEEGSIVDPMADYAESTGPRQFTYYGAAVKLGEGTARSYYTTDSGVATEVGIALSEAALRGLPSGSGHSDGSHDHYNQWVLRMHSENPTAVKFMELNWNPSGHAPDGVYTLPHFDFHFYNISLAERDAIDPKDPQWAQKASRAPAAEYLPPRYVPAGPPGTPLVDLAVPNMGVHWMDTASPELRGQTFTETFIYGTWDGKVIFAEPMITKAFLETRPNYTRTLPTAQKGFTPGSYRIYWNAPTREYRVALTSLPR